jgi:hypothetical protein
VTKKAEHGRYGEVSSPASESRYQHTDEPCRLELSHDLSRWELNDPQILMLELAHGVLIDTETYIDCQYCYWRVAQVPVDGRLGDDDRTSALLILASSGPKPCKHL